MQKSVKIALVAVVVVIIGGVLGFWWFVLRDDAPSRATVATCSEGQAASEIAAPPEGNWSVTPGGEVFVGYRIQELFGGESIKKTAAGRTPGVTGTLTLTDGQITATDITADVTQLKSDQTRRDNTIREQGLETQRIPTATFHLTEPIPLTAEIRGCEPISFTAAGSLTLHGETKTVQIPLQATWNGQAISAAGGTTIVLADYGIDPPKNSFVSVDDEGEFEMQLTFSPG